MKKFLAVILVIVFAYLTSFFFVGKPNGYKLLPDEDFVEDFGNFLEHWGDPKVSKKDSIESQTYFNDAMISYNNGDYSAAAYDFDYSYAMNPYFYEALYYSAKCRYLIGEFSGAYYDFSDYIAYDGSIDSAFYYNALASIELEYYTEAITAIKSFLDINPNSIDGQYILAFLYYKTREPVDAKKVLTELIYNNPDFYKSYYLLSKIYFESDYFEEAIQYGRKAFEHADNDYDVMVNIGKLYLESNSKLDSAKYFLDKALEVNDADYIVYELISSYYFNKKDYKNALEYVNKAIEIVYDYEAVEQRGDILFKMKRYDEAIDDYNICYNNYYTLKYILKIADCFEMKGDKDKTLEYLSFYLDQSSSDDTLREEVTRRVQQLLEN